MTYLNVLLFFIMPPLAVLLVVVPRELWRWISGRSPHPDLRPYAILLAHVILALVYTTPWDNYLVANRVWWYAPDQVLGITLGWVPIEEYGFFVLQTLLTGLWTLGLLQRRTPAARRFQDRPALRRWGSGLIIVLWVAVLALGAARWTPGTYMVLILGWGLPPLLLQVAFGADILLHRWRVLALAISLPTVYLWIVDAIAIGRGTWTIDPVQTTGILVGNLPLEEMLFFLITNLMVGFGIALMASPDSQRRARSLLGRLKARLPARPVARMDLGEELE